MFFLVQVLFPFFWQDRQEFSLFEPNLILFDFSFFVVDFHTAKIIHLVCKQLFFLNLYRKLTMTHAIKKCLYCSAVPVHKQLCFLNLLGKFILMPFCLTIACRPLHASPAFLFMPRLPSSSCLACLPLHALPAFLFMPCLPSSSCLVCRPLLALPAFLFIAALAFF